jgi:hypothetical protein
MTIAELKIDRKMQAIMCVLVFIFVWFLALPIAFSSEPLAVFGLIGFGTGISGFFLTTYSRASVELRLREFEAKLECRTLNC